MSDMTPFLNEIANICHYRIFWNTPYRTGNLARNGIGDIGSRGLNAVGFNLFGVGAEYGKILNEAQTIRYRVRNPITGQVYEGEYVNKHYMWVDKFAEQFANELPLYAPVRRIL